jgi:DNA primase catalytic core
MARIPEDQIERIKQTVPIERLCRHYSIELKPQGKNLVGRCPWHQDDTPSFIVTPEKNLWHCMGACDEGGNVFQLVMKAEKVSFRQAYKILSELTGDAPAVQTVKTYKGKQHAILIAPDAELTDADLLGRVADFYHGSFLNTPAAGKYLESRCCIHPAAIKHFKIGYCNRTLSKRIPPQTCTAGKQLKSWLRDLGVYRKNGHEHLHGCVVFPITDLTGQTVQLYGRRTVEKTYNGPAHLYLSGPMRGVWNGAGIIGQKTWVLCEAIIDALTLWCHGVRNVTTCFGKNTFTDDLWTLLKQSRPDKVLIGFDADDAGDKAAEKLAPRLAEYGASVHRIGLPKGRDINEYVCALMHKNPKYGASAIEGLMVDAPIMARSAAGKGVKTTSTSSSLAANSAAEEKISSPRKKPAGLDVQLVCKGTDVEINFGDRQWRIRGLAKNQSPDVMKVNLRVMAGSLYHVDGLDLYSARHRTSYINAAAGELKLKAEIIKRDIGKVLLKLEQLQDEQIKKAMEPEDKTPQMTEAERKEALDLLKSPNLLDRIVTDFGTWGLVGERTNKLVGYLAAVSRKLEKPLAVVVQSASAAGKSTLMEAILAMMPEEQMVQYSAMTGQSLFYFGNKNLKHKILAIVEEEGAKHAAYALKLLQSEGKLTIASTGKDATTGQMVTKEYKVEGPVMILTTTTAIEIDEELINRCLILAVDEGREQTQAIHKAQHTAETLSGLQKRLEKTDVLRIHKNAQHLLKPVEVVNPYAHKLTFLDDRTRMRRDHKKYLTVIRSIAFLHQYQRPVKTLKYGKAPVKYVEVTKNDIIVANELAADVLGCCLDELSPQSRRFLDLVYLMVVNDCKRKAIDQADYRFTQRQVRQYTCWSNYQVKIHLKKLVDLEYVLVHKGGRGQCFVCELLYTGQGKDGDRFLMGLIDAVNLS